MYIRIEFEDIGSEKTNETQSTFFGSPSGTCLSSKNAHKISSNEIREAVGNSIVFWYLDIDVLNKYYGGAIDCLYFLKKYSGVASIDILPIEERYDNSIVKIDELCKILVKYIGGVK